MPPSPTWFQQWFGRVDPVRPPAPVTPRDLLRVMRRGFGGRFTARPGTPVPTWLAPGGGGDQFELLAPHCELMNRYLEAACAATDRSVRAEAALSLARTVVGAALDLVTSDLEVDRPEVVVGEMAAGLMERVGFRPREGAPRQPAVRLVAAVAARVLRWLGFRPRGKDGRRGPELKQVIRRALSDFVSGRATAEVVARRVEAAVGPWAWAG